MAKSGLITSLGAVILPTGFNMDVQTMRINEIQDSEDVSFYPPTASAVTSGGVAYSVFRATGLPKQDITCTGYPYKGTVTGTAITTSCNVGIGQMSYQNNSAAATGATASFSLDTGILISGTYISTQVTVDHSKIVAGAKTTIMLKNSADITVAWAGL